MGSFLHHPPFIENEYHIRVLDRRDSLYVFRGLVNYLKWTITSRRGDKHELQQPLSFDDFLYQLLLTRSAQSIVSR